MLSNYCRLAADQQTVLVYAVSKQVPINDVAVGDLVMIIGELRSTCNTTVADMELLSSMKIAVLLYYDYTTLFTCPHCPKYEWNRYGIMYMTRR